MCEWAMRMVRKWSYVISLFYVRCKKWHKFPKIFVDKTSDLKLDKYYARENSSADLNENYLESYERRNQSFEYRTFNHIVLASFGISFSKTKLSIKTVK